MPKNLSTADDQILDLWQRFAPLEQAVQRIAAVVCEREVTAAAAMDRARSELARRIRAAGEVAEADPVIQELDAWLDRRTTR
jgi:hypothetical protein